MLERRSTIRLLENSGKKGRCVHRLKHSGTFEYWGQGAESPSIPYQPIVVTPRKFLALKKIARLSF